MGSTAHRDRSGWRSRRRDAAVVMLLCGLGLAVCSPCAFAAKHGLRLSISRFSGSATYVIDNRQSGPDTPLTFTERITWRLDRAARSTRDVAVATNVPVALDVHVDASAHGVYAVLDPNRPSTLIPYDCAAKADSAAKARLRVTPARHGGYVVAAMPFAPDTLDPGAATCTDADAQRLFSFPTGSDWFSTHLVARGAVGHLGPPPVTVPFARERALHHDCHDTPGSGTCDEQLSFSGTLRLTIRRR
jgi:hypothetical protein